VGELQSGVVWEPTNLPWGIQIDPQYRLPGHENQATYHPLFLYESLWNFGIVALLLWLGRRYQDRLLAGDLFLIYLIAYPIGRFLLEFLRLDPSQVGVINVNQALMLVVALLSAGGLIWRHIRQNKSAKPTEEARE
jgi:phosphatidylglycerol:prolipoprotein diacylglycerol transferase